MAIDFKLNSNSVSVSVPAGTPLLEVLRNDLKLHGPKFGCGLGQCGACTVLINGQPIRSCITPHETVANQSVTTIEGLGNETNPHPFQTALLENQALQCGYCASGIVTAVAGLLDENPLATGEQIVASLSGHLCRCGAQPRIIKAIEQTVAEYRRGKEKR